MLRECRQVAQVNGEPIRRWFHDELFDLLVWFDGEDQPIGFELIHDPEDSPRALVYRPTGRLSYSYVDDGSSDVEPAYGGMARILGKSASFPRELLLKEFTQRSEEMEPRVAQFVRRVIRIGTPAC